MDLLAASIVRPWYSINGNKCMLINHTEAQNQYGVTAAQAFYYAARLYNSGEIPDPSDLGNSGGSTNCYVSDVANRLTGWVNAPSKCTESNA